MVVSVNRIVDQDLGKYDVLDQSLIPSKDFIRNFGDVNDYVEAHVYTKDGVLITSDYNYKGYKIPANIDIASTPTVNSLEFDPAAHIQKLGYNSGDFKINYRVYRKKIFDLAEKIFFINEVSNDRTEIRLISNLISNATIEDGTLNFLYEVQTSPYFKDFLLNFGDDATINAVNIALDKNTKSYSIVVKLYQPLPVEFDLKSALWIVEELADPIQFEVELALDVIPELVEMLGPANFNLELDSHQAISSTYQSLNTVYSTDSLTSYQNVVNKLSDRAVGINVNYSDFSNFIHFSSAVERLSNFVYKVQTIESYQDTINTLKTVPNYTSGSVSASVQTLQGNINSIIQKFDGYESYLYNVSESTSWPKLGTYPSYSLMPYTSSQVLSWLGTTDESSVYYGGIMQSSSLYDLENQDNLILSIPEFVTSDSDNDPYVLFMNMVGQHFDNIWIYIKAINDLHKADSSFKEGISKDMVYTALKSLGIKLYNNNTNENIFDYLLGNTSGSYTVSGSHGVVSGEDRSKELFKRIYHNLPYLLKSKGTNRGIKALISTFGIPETILDVTEYGGSDKFEDTLEYSYDRFNYALVNDSDSNIDLKWAPLTQNKVKYNTFTLVPDAIELKFKPNKDAISSKAVLLQQFNDGVNAINFGVTMDYTSSNGVPSANVNFLLSDINQYVSTSLTLPIYATGSDGDTGWWNLLLRRNIKYSGYDPLWAEPYDTASVQQYDLIIKNTISGRIGHQASASIYATGSNAGGLNNSWSDFGDVSDHYFLTIGGPSLVNSHFPSGSNFNGLLQEVRYWSEPLSNEAFDNHVLNGESYEGNNTGSAYNDLAARFPLGNNLVTYNHSSSISIQSVHPNYKLPYSSGSIGSLTGIALYGSAIYGGNLYGSSGSLPFTLNENKAYFYRYPDQNSYTPQYTENYTNAPNSGYYTPVSEKVRIIDNTISSSVLSPNVRMENVDRYRTKDVHFTDVSFSPQNEIDKDIIAQYGGTLNIDDLIGVPSNQYESIYKDLSTLQKDYYTKFASKYNYTDVVRLIKTFDNTLFKMIEDYVPARTNLSTGVTIKSPLLERNKVKRHKPDVVNEGANEGVIEGANFYTDTSNVNTNGSTEEFITGELVGTVIDLDEEFNINNLNPYLFPTESINQDTFDLSVFNVQQGVVNQNATSRVRRRVDSTNPNITDVAEIQDGYYEYKRHSLPRYEGSKSTSRYYNTYTVGDSAYGKNAAIDYNVGKFGWIDTVSPKNLNFYNKTTLSLKYLVDASGSLTELNTENRHLFEVQNTFKSGDQLVVSLLDKNRPTNQNNLNGTKEIHLGGFSYSPILYRELDETLYFKYLNPTVTESINLGIKAYSTSSYSFESYAGRTVASPIEVPANTGAGYFFKINGSTSNTNGIPMASISYPALNWPYYSSGHQGLDYFSFGGIQTDRGTGSAYVFDLLDYNSFYGGYNTEPETSTYENINGKNYYVVPRSGQYAISGSIGFSFGGQDSTTVGWSLFKAVGVVESSTNPYDDNSWSYVTDTVLTSLGNPTGGGGGWTYAYNSTTNTIKFDADMYSRWNFSLDMRNTSPVTLTAGQYIRFRFCFIDTGNGFDGWTSFQFYLSNNSFFEIYDADTFIEKLITTGSIGQYPDLFSYDSGTGRGITFDSSSVANFYSQSVFTPESPYSDNYTPVYNPFVIEVGDTFRFGEFDSPSSKYYEVMDVYYTPDLTVVFDRDLTVNDVNPESFAILRKSADETSIILNFNKIEGETSKAMVIPVNLHKTVKDRVADIIQPLRVPLSTT